MFPFSIQKEKAFRVSAGIGPTPTCLLVSHHQIPAQTRFKKKKMPRTKLSLPVVTNVLDDRTELP